jgi:signal transduction histidine kinase
VTRRIVTAIVIVAALAVVAFGLPLGVVIDREYESQALLRLERLAIVAERSVPAHWRPGDSVTLESPRGDTRLALYDALGRRVVGVGPEVGDDPVQTALFDRIDEAESGGSYVIAVPIIDGGAVVGALRADQSVAVTDRRIRTAWAAMGLLGFAVIASSLWLARRLARRIAVPVEALQQRAARLGTETSAESLPPSGMAEIDDVAAALDAASVRVSESVDRERAFSAEVSHQLRTPITALRLLIDTEQVAPRPDPLTVLDEATAALARLEATVDDLLSLARNRPTDRGRLLLGPLLAEVVARWEPAFGQLDREVHAEFDRKLAPTALSVVASRSAIEHVLDVLIDNALRHGHGDVGVGAESIGHGIAIRVRDDGSLPDTGTPRRGIGLQLAERLAQAEGGDLVCSSRSPTTFSVLMPES